MKTAKAVLGGLVLVLMWAAVHAIGIGILYGVILGVIWLAAHVSVIGWLLGIVFGLVALLIIVAVVWMAVEEVQTYGFRGGVKHSFKEFFRG